MIDPSDCRPPPMMAQRRVTGAGVQLQAYSMSGDGPTLVCIHGLTTGGCVFFQLLPLLGANWTRVAIDLRGHGLSDRAMGRYALTDYAADVAAVLEREIDGRVDAAGAAALDAIVRVEQDGGARRDRGRLFARRGVALAGAAQQLLQLVGHRRHLPYRGERKTSQKVTAC